MTRTNNDYERWVERNGPMKRPELAGPERLAALEDGAEISMREWLAARRATAELQDALAAGVLPTLGPR